MPQFRQRRSIYTAIRCKKKIFHLGVALAREARSHARAIRSNSSPDSLPLHATPSGSGVSTPIPNAGFALRNKVQRFLSGTGWDQLMLNERTLNSVNHRGRDLPSQDDPAPGSKSKPGESIVVGKIHDQRFHPGFHRRSE